MQMLSNAPIKLLLVEDNPGDARLVQIMLRETGGFRLTCAASLAEARQSLIDHPPEAILLDLSLPDCQGMDTVDAIRKAAPQAPVVIFTGLNDEAVGLSAMQHGCQDYLVKGQGDGNLIRRTVVYAIERKAADEERRNNAEQLKRVLLQTVRAVSLTLEMRDPYTAGHQRRVAQLALLIGRRMGLSEDRLEGLHTGALIHDIGKINVPLDFLSRPGKLSEAAFRVVQQHSAVGFEIVQDIDFPWPVAKMILQHHERLDGTGYPQGISGDDIILEARILAVADVVEAISSHRPYRPALGLDFALAEIQRNSGTHFDPEVVAACLDVIREGGAPFTEE